MKKILLALLLIFLLFTLTFSAGLGLTLYFKQNPVFIPLIQRLAILVSMGIISGFACRLLLRRKHNFWRILLVLLVIPLTLFTLDKLISNEFAVNFFKGNWNTPVWGDFAQICIGWVLGIFFLLIGARPKSKQNAVVRRPQLPEVAKRIVSTNKNKSKGSITRKTISNTRSKPVVIKRNQKIRSDKKFPTIGLLPKTRRTGRKDVKLMGETEHRCPYCLELVKKNDPRGVVICPECKTWHHKDCWDITGTCQVAHRHEL